MPDPGDVVECDPDFVDAVVVAVEVDALHPARASTTPQSATTGRVGTRRSQEVDRGSIPGKLADDVAGAASSPANRALGCPAVEHPEHDLADPGRPVMHGWTESVEATAQAVIDYARERLRLDPVPLDGPVPYQELLERAGATVTPEGLGGSEALRIFTEILAPACLSIDHPRHLAFIPCAPTETAMLFDLVVGASSIYGGSWLEGAGAVFAENQALAWLASLAGLPEGAGGVFVQGGTVANLSALVAARHRARERASEAGRPPATRFAMAASSEAHSSIAAAAAVMDVDLVEVAVGADGRLTGPGLETALKSSETDGAAEIFAVVASSGTTNLGIVDDLSSISEVTRARELWLHVDGAYGGAGLAAPSVRWRFAGIENADSFVVDPHKWLFAPFDCAALLYRDPEVARRAHAQHAGYLEPLRIAGEWNPSDFAIHLSRRARGLPFWFSLATFGTKAYSASVERTLAVTAHAVAEINERSYLELLREPELTVVCFRRRGWDRAQYYEWSQRLVSEQVGFVTPTVVEGETVARFAIVNPTTTEADIDLLLDSMI